MRVPPSGTLPVTDAGRGEDAEPEGTTVGDEGQAAPGDPARTPAPALLLRLGGCPSAPRSGGSGSRAADPGAACGGSGAAASRGTSVPEPAGHQPLLTKISHSGPPEAQREDRKGNSHGSSSYHVCLAQPVLGT